MPCKKATAYIELWFDAEDTQKWRITVWYISDKDFDPFTSEYITLDFNTRKVHEAKRYQEKLASYLKEQGLIIYVNNYNPNSYFWLRPAWLERMISNV